jgi:uncharacterized protein (DUF58 family)
MSRLARRLSSLARSAGLAPGSDEYAQRARPVRTGWRGPLDDALLRRLEQITVLPRRRAGGGLGGEHRSRARAASNDFVDHRPYASGDDFRQVDWNVYSRLDQLYVKQTEARERLILYLFLDCSASMAFGQPSKFDYARQLAAVIGYVTLARYDRLELVSLAGSGGAVRLLRGKQRFNELLVALDSIEARGGLNLDSELASVRRTIAGGQAVLISDMLHPGGYEGGLNSLSKLGLEPSVIQVLSPQELEPDTGGDLELEDLESGERVEVGLSPQAVAIYRARLSEWYGGVERYCANRGLRYLLVSTEEPLERATLVGLRQVGILN